MYLVSSPGNLFSVLHVLNELGLLGLVCHLPLSVHALEVILGERLHHCRAVAVAQQIVCGAAAVTEGGERARGFVTRAIFRSTSLRYLHKPVNGPEERDVLVGGVDGGENDQHEDKGGAGDAGRSDGSGGRGQTEPKRKINRDDNQCDQKLLIAANVLTQRWRVFLRRAGCCSSAQ
jgi:hypothetical protein